MSDIVLKAENISKQYRLGVTGSGTLRDDLARSWAKLRGKEDPTLKIGQTNTLDSVDGDYVWALQDINFEVKQGEVLGIIGKNGAGKSTLLKILSKVTGPTTGTIKTKGRIASLLEVGTGFHPELTGRENIYLNGAILGMTKREIKNKIDEIIDFSGVAKYIDTPIKRYSSGMTVRLAFAVAAFLDPEILIVDEVLAVGDAEFQKKAIGKMQDISSGEGRTVLFVSHNMASVQALCNRGILMANGKIVYGGLVKETIDKYLNINSGIKSISYLSEKPSSTDILSVELYNGSDKIGVFRCDDDIKLSVKIRVEEEYTKTMVLGYKVINSRGVSIFTTQKNLKEVYKKESIIHLESIIPKKNLVPDTYVINIALHIPNQHLFTLLEEILQFTVEETGSGFAVYQGLDYGCVFIECKWAVSQ